MQNGAIPDSALTASSKAGVAHSPKKGRLNYATPPAAWSSGGAHYLKNSWFQVDFGSWTKVTRIATQGRKYAYEWVTRYRVSYSYDGIFFKEYTEGASYPKVVQKYKSTKNIYSRKGKLNEKNSCTPINPKKNIHAMA